MKWHLTEGRSLTDTATDKDDIRELLYIYCHLIDDGMTEECVSLFTEDAVFEAMSGERISGRPAIGAYISGSLPPAGGPAHKHLTMNPVIDLRGEEASVVSVVLVVLEGRDGPQILLAGRYKDDVVRRDTKWRFKERVVRSDMAADLGLNKGPRSVVT